MFKSFVLSVVLSACVCAVGFAQENDSENRFEQIRLKKMDAKKSLSILSTVMDDAEFRLEVLSDLNAVLIFGEPKVVEEAKSLLEQLDTSAIESSIQEVRVFQLANSKADEMARVVEEMFGSQPGNNEFRISTDGNLNLSLIHISEPTRPY